MIPPTSPATTAWPSWWRECFPWWNKYSSCINRSRKLACLLENEPKIECCRA
jgi:hypothetical protein